MKAGTGGSSGHRCAGGICTGAGGGGADAVCWSTVASARCVSNGSLAFALTGSGVAGAVAAGVVSDAFAGAFSGEAGCEKCEICCLSLKISPAKSDILSRYSRIWLSRSLRRLETPTKAAIVMMTSTTETIAMMPNKTRKNSILMSSFKNTQTRSALERNMRPLFQYFAQLIPRSTHCCSLHLERAP